jgi:aspartyl-tRNA(Asn)/glutamyl-tRNA(Gln) amidotransferase subunit A
MNVVREPRSMTNGRISVAALRGRLDRGETTSRALCDEALARIADPAGEGATTFTETFAAEARAAADAADVLRAAGYVASPLAGLPVSVKDLFDVAGSTTRAGSRVLATAPPASADARIVRRLRAAGAVIVGKTGMTEFAYSGLGINPHDGTPRNPYDRATGRIPGGSSSGAAVSVTDGMAVVAIGTDTGGSVRIPAALCGCTGFKPTAHRVPLAGAFPLSFTLDSIGPLAANVADCALTDRILAGESAEAAAPMPPPRLRLLAPTSHVLDDADAHVLASFERALAALRAAGATVDEAPFPAFDVLEPVTRGGGFSAAEAYWRHRELLAAAEAAYDPQIAKRIRRGASLTAADYISLQHARRAYIDAFNLQRAGYDALVWPTVAIAAPPIAALLADDEVYARINLLVLRNTSYVNAADGCALSLPMHASGTAPAGLMIVGGRDDDRRILAIGASVEAVLAPLTTAA